MKLKEETAVDKPFDFSTWEFKTPQDYKIYNDHCHAAFREAKKNNIKADPPFPVKVPPADFYPTVTVKFQRFEQPENVLKATMRTKDISWTGQLKPGCTYELPLHVVKFLNGLATPIFQEVKIPGEGDDRTETKQVGERSRFSCHQVM